ncbi:acyl-homoserine-lactone synthase [Devosia ginsengisoli]|uniref:acyl-homoserine-lactone synthase n=1 Tax=Devosia ginsengisoli TaxID=400770 RepID=UPI0026E9F185|nr:acyl-homoserine-lactone synthase [Devosia ginsengisoli]MCR6671479.1 GNAT family N-acetyltransferase [Devosia ginsengisoli]
MQFHFITKDNEHLFQPELEQFFRARHVVYAEELGWVPRSPDWLEYDQFDTGAAAYLVVLDGNELVAGSRFIPTHLPHLLSEVFPNSCGIRPMVRDAAVVEWTRGFIIPSRRGRESIRIMASACAAVMEYALAQGYRQVGGIQDTKWIPLWKKMEWSIHVHGEPVDIDGRPWLPIYFDVTEAAMLAARALARIEGPLLGSTATEQQAA